MYIDRVKFKDNFILFWEIFIYLDFMVFLSLISIFLLKKNLLNRIRKERVIKGDCLMFYSLVNSKFKFIFWGMLKGGIYYKYGKSGYFYEMYF